jgi:hypothetical protein
MNLLKYIFLFLPLLGYAQSPDLFHVQFDRDYYVASENVWFTVHFLNEAAIESKVFYVDLMDPNGQVLLSQKLKIEDKNTYGDFQIPPDWEEGLYTFRAYTYWNLNFGSKFIFSKPIPIYSLSETTTNTPVGDFQMPDFQIFTPDFQESNALLNINIETEREQFEPREKVTLDIEIKDRSGKPIDGSFSVLVKNSDFFSRKSNPTELLRKKQNLERLKAGLEPLNTIQFPIENNLRMRVHISNDTMISSISYLPPVYFVEDRTKVSSELGFPPLTFLIPDFNGERNVQLLEFKDFQKGEDYFVEDVQDFFRTRGSGQTILPHTPEIDRYLSRVRQQRKMEQVFQMEVLSPLPDYPKIEMAGQADKIYKIDDFATFGDIFSFSTEVIGVPLARVIKKKNGKQGIRLFNQDHNRKLAEQPLYLINNHVEFDEDKALGIEWENIERIELITRDVPMVQHFGTLGINGVFAIYTRDRKIPESLKNANYNAKVKGYYLPRNFNIPDYEMNQNTNNRQPDIRATEYWNPYLKSNKKGKATIEFYSSDARGRYFVHVEGVSEQGEIFIGETTYLVR